LQHKETRHNERIVYLHDMSP